MGLFMHSRQQDKPAGSQLRDDPLWRSSAKRGGQLALLCLLRGGSPQTAKSAVGV
jgi:hypothetical protein